MAQNSGISWTDDTFNAWWGCVERGPGCANCYAKALAKRYGWDVWGAKAPRRLFGPGHAKALDTYQRIAIEGHPGDEKKGIPPHPALRSRRVFVGSMMDIAEEREDTAPIARALLSSVERYDALDLLLVTKRPEHYEQMFRDVFPGGRLPGNVWLGCSAVTQTEIDRFAPLLADLARRWQAAAAFLSIEPQLEDVTIPRASLGDGGITWIITGGESASDGREYRPKWAASLIGQARAAGIAPFVKQMGTIAARAMGLRGKGDEPSAWPDELRVQEFPLPRRVLSPRTITTAPRRRRLPTLLTA